MILNDELTPLKCSDLAKSLIPLCVIYKRKTPKPVFRSVQGLQILGSQSEHRTNRACAGTYLTDTFSHSVLQELSLIAEIPQLYSQERLSLAQIAEQCWVSRVYVRKVLREAGVSLDGKPPPQALTGQTPFGWKKEKGKLAPHLAEQKTIETMIRLRKAGQSLHSIARELTTGGVRTKNGGKWHAKSVSQILESNSRLMDQYKNRDSNIRKEK